MPVKVRPYTRSAKGGWEVDINVRLPNGQRHRERSRAPVSSKSTARRWGEERERHLAIHGPKPVRKEVVPTLAEFKERFIEGYCRAERQKPSGIKSKEYSYDNHLIPLFGKKRLDKITNEDVMRLKARLEDRAESTVNNVLSVLSKSLKVAVEWEIIERMPCKIRLLKVQSKTPRFYDFDEYAWLVEAAREIDPRILVLVLLGGDAGLRRGEMAALDLADADLRRGLLTVDKNEWRGQIVATKGREARVIPMSPQLKEAIAAIRHLRGPRLLYTDAGEPVTDKVQQMWMKRVQKKAGLRATGEIHILRHTFCSHLAMQGAPPIAIQKLAGHKSIQTTMRYMHLAEGEATRAIGLLEGRPDGRKVGAVVEQTAETAATP